MTWSTQHFKLILGHRRFFLRLTNVGTTPILRSLIRDDLLNIAGILHHYADATFRAS